MREHLLLFIAEFFDLLGDLPVKPVAFALGDLHFVFCDVAQDLRFGRTIGRKQLFNGAGSEIDASFGHYRVHDLAGAVEIRASRCVIAQSGAPNALFVLLIALLTGFFVLFGQLNVLHGHHGQVVGVQNVRICEVLVEILVLHGPLGVHFDHHRAVWQLFELGIVEN